MRKRVTIQFEFEPTDYRGCDGSDEVTMLLVKDMTDGLADWPWQSFDGKRPIILVEPIPNTSKVVGPTKQTR